MMAKRPSTSGTFPFFPSSEVEGFFFRVSQVTETQKRGEGRGEKNEKNERESVVGLRLLHFWLMSAAAPPSRQSSLHYQ